METVTDFLFVGSKITMDSNCSHVIKRCLLLGRKPLTNLDSMLKSRDITLLTKVHIVKLMVFPKRAKPKMTPSYFANKGPSSQGYGFSSSHVWM